MYPPGHLHEPAWWELVPGLRACRGQRSALVVRADIPSSYLKKACALYPNLSLDHLDLNQGGFVNEVVQRPPRTWQAPSRR